MNPNGTDRHLIHAGLMHPDPENCSTCSALSTSSAGACSKDFMCCKLLGFLEQKEALKNIETGKVPEAERTDMPKEVDMGKVPAVEQFEKQFREFSDWYISEFGEAEHNRFIKMVEDDKEARSKDGAPMMEGKE